MGKVVEDPNMFHLKGLGLIGGFERTNEKHRLYGVVYQYGESNQFVSGTKWRR